MSNDEPVVRADAELLGLARAVLVDEGFSIEDVPDDGLPLLLAENRYFIVCVTTAATINQLILAEGRAEEVLVERLRAADVGPKVWDAYLILLTQERLAEGGPATRELFDINYDTRAIRRIVHSGVYPTLAEVRNALTPFVAPVELDDPTIATSPFESFIEALVGRGIDRDVAVRAVTAGRQGADIVDAI